MLYGQSRIYYHGRHWGDTLAQSHFGAGIGPVAQDASLNRPIGNATCYSGAGLLTRPAGDMMVAGAGVAMTTPEHNYDHHFLVVKAVGILAAALGPAVAEMVAAKGFERYPAWKRGDPPLPLSTLAATFDASEVVRVMLHYWSKVFQPYFGDRGHQQVKLSVCNVRSIRNYYVGQHAGAECDYEPSDALGEIARLLRRFSADEAAR